MAKSPATNQQHQITITDMKPITSGQAEQCVTMIKDAARKAGEEAIAELKENNVINSDNAQRLIEAGDQMATKIKKFVKEMIAEMAEMVRGCLKLISGAETLTLDATDGTETIAQAGSTFNGYLDSDFRNWKLDVASQPTKEQKVSVHEMIEDGTFAKIYNGLSSNLDSLCLTQAQIINFVKKHRKWLRTDGYGTFFLFKRGEEFFVARVYVYVDGSLDVHVHGLAFDHVWTADVRHRVVAPQLDTLSA